jgi:antitoxin component of RelBE/YafQ-DinJ toxin-antitoxin module
MFRLLIALVIVSCALGLTMSVARETVLKPFAEGKALKIISGLNNFDRDLVCNVAEAAQLGGASHIDIACDPELVRAAKAACSLPICVSSVFPKDFPAAVEAGADMVEIGNFDCFYDEGMDFSAADVIAMTVETRALLPTIPLSVTVPHTLPLNEQIQLAKELEKSGADIIQTEGKMGVNPDSMGAQELIEKAAPTLASSYGLSRAVQIPVMCASGLTDVTAPLALAAGARGVGIGSMVNRLTHRDQMIMAVTAVSSAMGRGEDNSADRDDTEVFEIFQRKSISTESMV